MDQWFYIFFKRRAANRGLNLLYSRDVCRKNHEKQNQNNIYTDCLNNVPRNVCDVCCCCSEEENPSDIISCSLNPDKLKALHTSLRELIGR